MSADNGDRDKDKDKDTQSTLIRGFVILEKILEAGRPMSSAWLAEELDLPKASVHRIAQQLEDQGLLQREPDGKRFMPGTRLRKLALGTLASSGFNAHRHLILQKLSDQVGETCNLTMLDSGQVVYLDRVEANWPYRIHLPVGSRLPLHATATGKLFLAHMPARERQRWLQALPLLAHTALTQTHPERLEQELEMIRDRGVSLDSGEFLEGMIAVAVPVRLAGHRVQMALAIHAPSARRSLEELEQHVPELLAAAAQLARAEQDNEPDA